MDISTFLYIIIIIVIIILIFKIIKKVIFAVITVILFLLLITAGIGTLAYQDYKGLTQLETYNVNVIYGDIENIKFGITIPFENKEIIQDKISSLDLTNINEEYFDNVDEKEGNFYVLVSEDLFNNILEEDKQYYLTGTQDFSYAGFDIETNLTKKEVQDVINSKTSLEKYINIIISKNEIPNLDLLGVSTENIVKEEIEKKLKSLKLRDALFLSVLADLNKDSTVKLILGFKNDELRVFPEKFSFKLLKMIPIGTFENLISTDDITQDK